MSDVITLTDRLTSSFPDLPKQKISLLDDYYRLVLKWNKKISLTTLTSVDEFANRHLGESLFASVRIDETIAEFWDIGSGVGVPGIPTAILRPSLVVRLVESNRKKAIFLEEVAAGLGLRNVSVLNARFETLEEFGENACVAARAVERMEVIVRALIEKAKTARQILIFGGPGLDLVVPKSKRLRVHLLPGSSERFLYEVF